MRAYACMHACTHNMCMCVHVHVCVCACVCACGCGQHEGNIAFVNLYVNLCVHMHHVHVHVCVYACVCDQYMLITGCICIRWFITN